MSETLPKTPEEWRKLAQAVIDERTKSYVEAARQMARFVIAQLSETRDASFEATVKALIDDSLASECTDPQERSMLAAATAVVIVVHEARRRFEQHGDTPMQARTRAVDMVAYALGEADDRRGT